jgi:RNA polymerase sigma factor (sigma-70 family)
MKKYNRSAVMKRAWYLFKNLDVKERTDKGFSRCLKNSWAIEKATPQFNEYYIKYKSLVMNRIGQTIKNSADCEDICAEVFVKLFNYLHTFDCNRVVPVKFTTWLMSITKNAVIDHVRHKKLDYSTNMSDLVNSEGQETFSFVSDTHTLKTVEDGELSLKIESAMSKLKPQYRKVFELYFKSGKKYTQIAEELQIPLNTVKGTLLRAKAMLQEYLQKEYAMLNM